MPLTTKKDLEVLQTQNGGVIVPVSRNEYQFGIVRNAMTDAVVKSPTMPHPATGLYVRTKNARVDRWSQTGSMGTFRRIDGKLPEQYLGDAYVKFGTESGQMNDPMYALISKREKAGMRRTRVTKIK